MSRDLQDFVQAFGVGASIGNGINRSRERGAIINDKWGYGPRNDPNGELEKFDRENGTFKGYKSGFERLGDRVKGWFGGTSNTAGGATGYGGTGAAPAPQLGYNGPPIASADDDGNYDSAVSNSPTEDDVADAEVAQMRRGGPIKRRTPTPIQREIEDDGGVGYPDKYGSQYVVPPGSTSDEYYAQEGDESSDFINGPPDKRGSQYPDPVRTPAYSPESGGADERVPQSGVPIPSLPARDPLWARVNPTSRPAASPDSGGADERPPAREPMGDASGYVDSPRSMAADSVLRRPPSSTEPSNGPAVLATPTGAGIAHPVARQLPGSPLGDEAILHGVRSDAEVAGSLETPAGGTPAPASAPAANPAGAGAGTGGAATGATGVTRQGQRPWKRLNDQTRTDAFDEEKDRDDPDNILRDAIHGGLKFAQDTFHLNPSAGGIPRPDARSADGAKALFSGIGAATPQEIEGLNRIVQQQHPNDDYKTNPSLLPLRRMEIVYRNMVQTGQTDKANKMAFEIMQYSAGVAAQMGDQAAQLFRGGNVKAATAMLVKAYDAIPDGRNVTMNPDGRSASITDRTGKVVDQLTFTPQQVFQAAMGLSNRSLYWQVLMQRAAQTKAAMQGDKNASQDAVNKKRIELMDARINRLNNPVARGGKGAAAPAPVSPDLQKAIDAIGGTGSSAAVAAPAQGSSESEPEPAPTAQTDEADNDALHGNDGAPGDQKPATEADMEQGDSTSADTLPRPAGAPPVPKGTLKDAPASVLRTKPAAKTQGVFRTGDTLAAQEAKQREEEEKKPFDPEGDGYDYKTAKAAGLGPDETGHWPSRDPKTGKMLKGRKHETWDKAVQADKEQGYVLKQGKDGSYYSEKDVNFVPNKTIGATERGPMPEFTQPNPEDPKFKGKNPYRELLANPQFAPEFATKSGQKVRQGLANKAAEYDKQVAAYKAAKAKHEADWKTQGRNEDRQDTAVEKAEAAKLTLGPKMAQEVSDEIKDVIAKKGESDTKEKLKTLFNDGTVKPTDVHDIAMAIATATPSMSPEMAVRAAGSMMITDDEDRNARAFTPLGHGRVKDMVILKVGDRQIKMREADFQRMNAIIHKRWDAQRKGAADTKAAAESNDGFWGTVDKASRASSRAVDRTAQYITGTGPYKFDGGKSPGDAPRSLAGDVAHHVSRVDPGDLGSPIRMAAKAGVRGVKKMAQRVVDANPGQVYDPTVTLGP